jgi:hypothetical protein
MEHPSPAHLVGVVVERSEKSDANLSEVFEIRVRDFPGGTVVFDEILVVLVIGSRELGERAQILRRASVWL